ncbi:hypothetical protein [Pseudomonas mucidolens]|uniref:Uncharacterized protein n=1 Tax=Pseudomonas mucidolens TaxID=46679 RepID=A0A1H2M8N3_9PSED|nr:hypothetical protein [Pseudomonas mucidolens]SDU88846.1 hypothetical protein SAMN05216202_1126 [Pseudomonas mucidolens]SQH34441.1 Uncharacterised protein [Pseudomonas mucidolens]
MGRTNKQPYVSKAWMIALVIGLVFVAIGYGVRFVMDDSSKTDAQSWLDLALFLCGYLLFFCLKPIQAAIHRKLRRRAFRNARQKTLS